MSVWSWPVLSTGYRTAPLDRGASARVSDLALAPRYASLAHGLRQCRPDPLKLGGGNAPAFRNALDAWRFAVDSVASTLNADDEALDGEDAFNADLFRHRCNW